MTILQTIRLEAQRRREIERRRIVSRAIADVREGDIKLTLSAIADRAGVCRSSTGLFLARHADLARAVHLGKLSRLDK